MPYKKLFYFLNLHKGTFLLGTIFVILANVASSYTNKLVEKIINTLVGVINSTSDAGMSIQKEVFVFLSYYIGLTILSAVFTFLMRQTIIVASRKIEQKLKDDLYAHIQRLAITHFKNFPIGDYMSRMAEDVGKIRELFGPAVMYLVNMITTLSVSIFFMLEISSELTLYALLPLPFLSFFIYFFNIYSLQFNKKLQEEMSAMTSVAQESYNGIRIIKSFTLENKVLQTFSMISDSFKIQSLKIVKLDSFFMPIVSLLMGASILLSIYKGGMLVIDNHIQIGGLTSFIMFVNRLLWPVMSIGWVASLFQKGKSALIRYEEIMDMPLESKNGMTAESNESLKGDIEFKNVSFTYEETGIHALKNVSFHIKPGERWLIIGKTGSGKSTLAELLIKFYQNYQGEILLDGKPLENYSSSFVREQISYIPQDVFLFSDTVKNNIAFNTDEYIEVDVLNSAKDAQIHNEVLQFKDGYDTMVGERGITLSGGQKQRISIARALIKPSPIYLFDDCLSALDVKTERQLIEAMNQRDSRSTILLITHRIFNQLDFHKVLVLDDGEVVEVGSQEELMLKKGYFYDIYKKQEMRQVEN
ncbi:MAG: ABC transporter ATP-binding protein [Chitinophagales bacterium]|nr:ABC transporter ATP-binding protein/permease [Sphingobacteriales bacterium]